MKQIKFDAVVGNPPYQLADTGGKGSSTPIYNLFVNGAKMLNPTFLSMIIPSRWFAGGKGLDEFRKSMISDESIVLLHDYLDAAECFPGNVEIKGGICYFLRNIKHKGLTKIVTHKKGVILSSVERKLKEDNTDVFIRYPEGVSVLKKVNIQHESSVENIASIQKPFGLRTFVHGAEKQESNMIKLFERGRIGYIPREDILIHKEWIDKHKVIISAAYNAGDTYPHQIIGKPIYAEPGSACTETYMVFGPFETEEECVNFIGYVKTRFFRFLVALKKSSQHAPSTVYSFVPIQDFNKSWDDAKLYAKYGITEEEQAFIESMIRPMD